MTPNLPASEAKTSHKEHQLALPFVSNTCLQVLRSEITNVSLYKHG